MQVKIQIQSPGVKRCSRKQNKTKWNKANKHNTSKGHDTSAQCYLLAPTRIFQLTKTATTKKARTSTTKSRNQKKKNVRTATTKNRPMSWSTKNRPMSWVQCWVTLAMASSYSCLRRKSRKKWAVSLVLLVLVLGGTTFEKGLVYLCTKNLAARFITILAPEGAVYYNFGAWRRYLLQFWRLKALFITILAPEGAVYYNFGAEGSF